MLKAFRKAIQGKLHKDMDVAICWKHVEKVQLLLKLGADPNGFGPTSKQYFLGKAVEGGNLEIINLLLDAGADAREPYKFIGYEIKLSEEAARRKFEKAVIDRLVEAEQEAIRLKGPGRPLRRPPADLNGILYPRS